MAWIKSRADLPRIAYNVLSAIDNRAVESNRHAATKVLGTCERCRHESKSDQGFEAGHCEQEWVCRRVV